MFSKQLCAAAIATVIGVAPVLAGDTSDIMISDAYARAASSVAKSGAVFMTIQNMGEADDRLVAAVSDAAKRVGLHTHIEDSSGVMRMVEAEDGFAVPAGGMHMLDRGGDHVMLMGLTGPLEQGDSLTVTLSFEEAGEIVVDVPVDNERAPGQAMTHGN